MTQQAIQKVNFAAALSDGRLHSTLEDDRERARLPARGKYSVRRWRTSGREWHRFKCCQARGVNQTKPLTATWGGRVWGVWSGAFRVDAASSRLLIRARQAKDKWINGALLGSSPLNINSHLDSSTVWFPFTACGLIGWQAGTRVFWGSDNRRTLCCEHGARHELSFQLCAGHRGTIPSLAVCNLENTSLIFFFFLMHDIQLK